MKVLVTGASGFLGRYVLPLLTDRHQVSVCSRQTSRSFSLPGVQVLQADLRKEDEVERVARQASADTLVHLAWSVSPDEFWTSPSNLDWVNASLNLVRAFARQGGKRMVIAGSCAEYDWQSSMPLEENFSPSRPQTLYGVCKDSLRRIVEVYAASVGLSCLWSRIFWPYGPGEPKEKFLSSLIAKFVRGERAVCRGANLRRDYVHVRDVARALCAAVSVPLGGVLNIGTGVAVSLGELARLAAHYAGHEDLLELQTQPPSENLPECVCASVARLRQELHWEPEIPLQDGIAAMVRAAQSEEGQA